MVSDYISPILLERVLVNMKRENSLAIWLSLETGLRIGDVLQLKWENLDGQGNITYQASKTQKKGKAKISKELRNELKSWRTDSIYIFPGRKDQKHRTRQAVYKDMKRAAKMERALDGKQVSPHSARKAFAVEVLREDGISKAQKALQHKSAMTTMIYIIQSLNERINQLERQLGIDKNEKTKYNKKGLKMSDT